MLGFNIEDEEGVIKEEEPEIELTEAQKRSLAGYKRQQKRLMTS